MRTVRFDGKDSWADFGLIRSGAEIEAPDPKTSTVDVDGADGVLDLTDYFGETLYKNRKIDITFSALPQGPLENVFVNTDSVIQPEIELKDNGKGGLTVYGQTRQNLWTNPATGTRNGVTLTANANGSVTVGGTATNTAIIRVNSYVLKPGAQYTISVDKQVATGQTECGFGVEFYGGGSTLGNIIVGGNENNLSKSFTVPDGMEYVVFRFRVPSGVTVSGTYRVMLNEGTEAEPWCPPGLNSIESLEIVTVSENLAAGELSPHTMWNTTGENISSSADSRYAMNEEIRAVNAGEVYTLECDANIRIALRYTDASGAYVNHSGWKNPGETVEIPSGVASVMVGVDSGMPGLDVMGVIGNSAVVVAQHVESTPIDLQGNALCSLPDGTRDELRVDEAGAVKLVKRVNKAVAPSDSGSWHYYDSQERSAFSLPATGANQGWNQAGELRCDRLPVAESSAETSYALIVGNSAYARHSSITDTASAADFMGGAEYVYKLAAEQEIDLGYIPMEQFDRSFHALFSRLQNAIHGKRCKIELSEDPGFYYMGRVTVDKWKTNEAVGEISVSCDCDPYKLRQGVTRRIVNGTGTAQTVTFQNLRKKVVPVFNTNGTAWTIKQGTNSFTANGSSWSDGKLYFSQGDNELTITGTGKLEVTYQERGL